MSTDSSRTPFAALLFLFIGSGCAALIYEITWFQMLQLAIGSSSISLGILLANFMGGMCLGSLLLPRIVPSKWHPIKVYAVLEILIAVSGILLLFLLPRSYWLYKPLLGWGHPILIRSLVASVFLLVPTIMMGATLPAIARWVDANQKQVAQLGFFYSANIFGAVAGCLLAGFVLLRLFDLNVATMVAVAINLMVAGVAWWLAAKSPKSEPAEEPQDSTNEPQGNLLIYAAVGISGMTALGAEVVWTRIQSLLLGATVYTFSIVLAVFLVGLGIGSSLGSALARRLNQPREGLAYCQFLLVGGMTWASYVLSESLPQWPVDVSLQTSPWIQFQLDVVRSLWAVLPATLCWGASFPLAIASISRNRDSGVLVSKVYAVNTLGAILGSLIFVTCFIPTLGTRGSQQLLLILTALAAIAAFWANQPNAASESNSSTFEKSIFSVVVIFVSIFCAYSMTPVHPGLIGYGRYYPTYACGNQDQLPEFIYVGEGINSSIAVSEFVGDSVNFHVSGKIVASSDPVDMKLQRMLGHLPGMIHEQPRKVLIVGCGAGVTSGSFIPYDSIEEIVVCEIEPLIPEAAKKHFGEFNHRVFEDRRTKVVFDDARHFVATTEETFDIITSDPIHPWVKGAAALYSFEYYELCKSKLNPGGIVTQWVPLYETNEAAVKSQISTFMKSFPNGTIWGNETSRGGYDIVLLGQKEPLNIDVEKLEFRMNRKDFQPVRDSMQAVKLGTPFDLLKTYGGQGADLGDWLSEDLINRDINFRLQYVAGMGLNTNVERKIYSDILKHRQYPDQLLQNVDEDLKSKLKETFNKNRKAK